MTSPRRLSLPLYETGFGGGVPRAGADLRTPPRAVRFSITDRCDLACAYCRPSRADGYLDPERRLSVDDWVHLARTLVAEGVTRFRITGGEPLLHPQVLDIIEGIRRLGGVRDLALTTNGTRLTHLSSALRSAGLDRLNVSIDSLDEARFRAITRGGVLARVVEGIDAARAAGFSDIKTNTVVFTATRPGDPQNDDELPRIVEWAWGRDLTPRFLEVMPLGEGARWDHGFVPFRQMLSSLSSILRGDPSERSTDRGPARYYAASDGSGRGVGFITGTSDTFCEGCDRLRVTSTGVLRACLATNDGVDVSAPLASRDSEGVRDGLAAAWARKPDGITWRGCTEPVAREVSMRATGG